MQFLKSIFRGLGACIKFINTYFKTFVFLVILLFVLFAANKSENTSQPNLVRIDLKGEIMEAESLVQSINDAKDNELIKGVLFVVDSPGGAVDPSMEIALAIKDLKEKKPVVTYASGTLASGSYLAAANSTKIISNPSSFVGSIGVIMEGVNFAGLIDKLGIAPQTLSAGKFKEAGTVTRPWSEEEREYLQGLVDKAYTLFTEFVATARCLELAKRDEWANARVFLAGDALKMGLIDELGNFAYAKKQLEQISGVKEPLWSEPGEKSKFDKVLDKIANSLSNSIEQGIQKALTHSNTLQKY